VVLGLEDWWFLTTPHNPKSVGYNVIQSLGICRTSPITKKCLQDTKFGI